MNPEYRGNPCPARSTGLPHTQQGLVCAHCGTPVTAYPGTPAAPAQPVPVDVNQRLRDLGLLTAEGAEHDDNTPVEQKMITGRGPQGRLSGPGRGEFSPRDMWRTVTKVRFREWLAAHGGGEEA